MRQLTIGEMRIDRLVEVPALPLDKAFLFANVTDEVIAANRGWLDERYIEPETGRFILSHHSYHDSDSVRDPIIHQWLNCMPDRMAIVERFADVIFKFDNFDY